ncbi:hypothetical protein DVH05_028210 [Phytophthora capsici]|nr:hypothetical protein DVH05_028210 [Phytophthora capsici]
MMAVPITTNECWLVWKFLCDWVKTQLAMEVPASIPGFGTFYVRVQPLGIRIILFEPEKKFLTKYYIQVDSDIADPALVATLPSSMTSSESSAAGRNRAASIVGLGEIFAFSFVEMASCCGHSVDSTRAHELLNVVIHKLGSAMGQGGRIELNIGAGVIVCVDRVIQRYLLPRDSRLTPRFEYEVRTGESIVKRNLRTQAALQKINAPKAKLSFLSGSTFASSIQLNPVLDRSKDVPDFSFGPRPPASSYMPIGSDARPSPRSTQLQKRYHRTASPRASRLNAPSTPVVEEDPANEGSLSMKEANPIPELFDPLSRTLCVEPDLNVSSLVPSNRIGSNFTETAAYLMAEKAARGLVFVNKPATAKTIRQRNGGAHESTSEQRYFEYLSDDKLIDRRCLAPLPTDVETRVVAAAVKYIAGPSTVHIEKVMEVAHQEFVDNYYASAKKAILNYLLMRAVTRERLGIPFGIPVHALLPTKWKWGSSDGPNGCIADLKALVSKPWGGLTQPKYAKIPQKPGVSCSESKIERRKRVQSKLASLLILSNPQVRALRYMWHDLLLSVSLVDIPSTQNLSEAIEPMDIIAFERAQLAFSTKMRTFMMENWYHKVRMMFESVIRAETFSIHTSEAAVSFRLRHLFDTVAAVMSLQIRSLILKSIETYVNFFELFGDFNDDNQESSSQLQVQERPKYSGLLTTLVLHDGQIQFRDPLVDIPSRLLNVLHNIPKLFYNLGRIETQFDEPIFLPTTCSPFLWNVAAQEDDVVVATIRIRAIIERNLAHLRKLQRDYDVFALTHRYVNSVDCFHLEENGELESYRAEMERVQATAMQLAIDNQHSQHLGLFSVDCRDVNSKLHNELGQWTIRLLQAFEQRTGRMNAELRQQYKEIAARLAKKPLDLYELVDAEAFVQYLKAEKLQELQDKASVIKQRLRFLLFERENIHVGHISVDLLETGKSENGNGPSLAAFRLSTDLLSSTAKTVKWRSHIAQLLKEAEALLVNERTRIEAMFVAKRSRFQAEIDEFEGEVRGFAKKGDLRHAATYVVQLAKMQDNLFIFRQAMGTIIKEEEKLMWKATDFSKLDDIAEEMAPYEQLWKTVREFREMNSRWLRGNIFELPGKEGLQTLQQMLSVVANVASVLLLNSAAAAITAETVRKQMTDFRENVRLIVAIQNPAMKERHMKAVSALIGLDFSSDEVVTLLKLLENGVFELISNIVDISSNATQEQQIERALDEMKDEWGATSFQLVPSKHPFTSGAALAPFKSMDDVDSDVWGVVLDKTCAEHIISLKEDHLLRLQTLSCMVHAGPFLEDIALWQAFASKTGQVVEILVLIEQQWRKLTPLFAAGIVETESTESKLFAHAAQLYRSTHATILRQPACKAYFPSGSSTEALVSPTASLNADLNQCRELLETVRAGVRVGFDAKRSSFTRFYFLSDSELVTALALANFPGDSTLWKALSRCFPGINSAQTNSSHEITALLSSAGEPFPLGSPIVTTDTPMPVWLAKVETSMATILHASIRAACSDLPRKEFRKWCLIWPEQSLLAAIQISWTLESEQAYQNENQRKAWTEITSNLSENLDAVRKEIRVAAYPHVKATLGNVILLLTQLRDISSRVLAEISTSSPYLTWIAQPRFYFIDSVLNVTMLTSSYLLYGLEYLGNGTPGILVTPLTLRCFHAIAQAASTMAKGACLQGEAGTGKSTICYQLARLCGRLYVTFQCGSTKLCFDDLVSFIKATASSGAWLCVDNLQLLDATKISLLVLLCSQVMTSLAARHAQCVLVGDKIRLRKGALFLLTRTIGPVPVLTEASCLQNTSYFFRPIVVQCPDIEKIAEFELQCGRFVHAAALAKLVAVTLTAFQRGFQLLQPADSVKVLGPGKGDLRQVKSIIRRATELNNLEKDHRRRTRKSILITPDVDETEDVSTPPVDATSEALVQRQEEEMEYRNVCLSLRERLASLVPPANLHLVDAIIRDFNAHALDRDLLRATCGNSMRSTSGLSVVPRQTLEDEVESYVRNSETLWKIFGVEFSLKVVQLLQTMRHSRAVVVSGEIQTGKSRLCTCLSQALTDISRKKSSVPRKMESGAMDSDTALAVPTRCVFICPRALRCGQLIDLNSDRQSQSVFAKLLKEAKTIHKVDKGTNTWIVFDGDLDASWSEQILYTVEDLQDEIPGHKKGLQLSSGKFFAIPTFVRVIVETTTLANASPTFVSRVGAVHVNGDQNGANWENVYFIWKNQRRAEFEGYADSIFLVLDTLVAETVPASVEFVTTNFQSWWGGRQDVERMGWMFALFYSVLKHSWGKFCSLTSEKQRRTAVHCVFLQALVWGIGNTSIPLERQKFHLFLYDLILRGPNNEQSTLKRLVTLFFPAGTLVDSNNDKHAGSTLGKQTIYDFGFSVDFGSKWLPWTEYYTRWTQKFLGSGSLSALNVSGLGVFPIVAPTPTTSAAIILSGQLLLANYPTILCGPKDCGKTRCSSLWLMLSETLSRMPAVTPLSTDSSQSEEADAQTQVETPSSEDPTGAKKIYAGYYTNASDVLFHFETILQHIRSRRQESSRRTDDSHPALPGGRHTVYVFVDDVHCFDCNRKMNSATEFLRMLAEQRTVVDPSTNVLTPCPNVLPFGTLQTPVPKTELNQARNYHLERFVRRCVPVPLQPFSDSDLISICESFPAAASATSEQRSATSSSVTAAAAALLKEAGQLQSTLIKASLKVFRLCKEFTKDATFKPIKLHYDLRSVQLFQLVESICCEIRPTWTQSEKPSLVRLWCHEIVRLFGDMIVDVKEADTFSHRVLEIALSSFGVADEVFFPAQLQKNVAQNPKSAQNWLANELHFSFMGENVGSYRNGYVEISEMAKVEAVVERNMRAMFHTGTNNGENVEIVLCSHVIKLMLRATRLLRMNNRAVLFLGAKGKKLVTITRLACFICKKTPSVYRISGTVSEEAHHNSKWCSAFRAALLKSVRTRDSSVVFIVKDCYLDPDSPIYRILDQFLGGFNNLSEVVTYDDLDEEILSIIRERQEQIPLSSETVSTSIRKPVVLRSKNSTIDHFFQLVRQNIQIVLIFSPLSSPVDELDNVPILWRYPNILKFCTVNYAGATPENSMLTMAQKCLAQSSLTLDKQEFSQFSEAAVHVYNTSCRFSRSGQENGAIVPQFMSVDPAMLVEHVALFASHFDRLERSISSNITRYENGLGFIDETAKILEMEQSQAELLLPEVQYKTELRRRMSGNVERVKMTADKLTRGLELATTLVTNQRERLAAVTEEYQDLISDSRREFDEMKGILQPYYESFDCEGVDDHGEVADDTKIDEEQRYEENLEAKTTHEEYFDRVTDINEGTGARWRLREHIREFTSLERIPSSILQLSECLGVIFGIEPVEGRDEMDPDEIIMNYWKNVALQIETAEFWEKLIAFDVPKNATEKMVSTLLPICRSPDFDKDLFASVHEIAGVLSEWVIKCITFARDFILAGPKYDQLHREQEQLKLAEAQVVKSKIDIYDQNASSRQTYELHDVSEMERQRADERLQDTTSLLHLTSAAWKVLSSTREKWQRKLDFYTEFATHWKGDLLLATATIVYASCLTRPLRLRLFQQWIETVGVSSSPSRRYMHDVFLVQEVDISRMKATGLPANDESALENAVIALNCFCPPLLIDPYGVATDWLKSHLISQKLAVVSASYTSTSSEVWRAVETSIKLETPLILTDICKERLESLHSFVSSKRRSLFDAVNLDRNRTSDGYRCWCLPAEETTVEQSTLEFYSDACRVFFTYTDSDVLPEWLSEYLSQLTVIQFEMTAPFVEQQALKRLLEAQGRLRELTEIRTLENEMIICDEQTLGLEEELLDFFSTEKAENVYADNSKALRIVANRSAAQTLESTKAEAKDKVHSHWSSLVSYTAVAKRCLDAVWAWREFNVVLSITDTFAEKTFPLSRVWRLLARAGETCSKADGNLEVVMACFTNYLQQSVEMNLRDEDRLLFRFLLALNIWQRRMKEEEALVKPGEVDSRQVSDIEMLGRLVALISCKTVRSDYDVCKPTLKSLLALRSKGMKSTDWSAICYLAETSENLRQFISRMESLEDGKTVWKDLLNLGTHSSADWEVPGPLDAFTRMCIVSAIYPHRLMSEIEIFAGQELQRIHTVPALPHSNVLVAESNTPTLPTVVATLAHTAMAQKPDRHRDLFYMWQLFSSSTTPLVVFCPPTIDFMDAVTNVARRAGATMDTSDTVQLLLAEEGDFKILLLQAMEKGRWVVLPNLQTSQERFVLLSRIYESLEDGRTHSDFRLWISITHIDSNSQVMHQVDFDSLRMSKFTIHRKWAGGYFSLKRSLHHTFAILKREVEELIFATTTTQPNAVLSGSQEKCLKQLGVFHALISSRDHFSFGGWKSEGEFGDAELCAVIRSLATLRLEKSTEVPGLVGVWTEMTLRGIISCVYVPRLRPQDQLLLESYLNLVLSAWPTGDDGVEPHSTATAAQMALPEAVFSIEKLATIPWGSIINAIPNFWTSESCGPPIRTEVLAGQTLQTEGAVQWDSQNIRKARQNNLANQLAVLAVHRGCHIPAQYLSSRFSSNMEVLSMLEHLAEFRENLDGIVLPTPSSDFDYCKPLAALVNRERKMLEEIRAAVLRDIEQLELVSNRCVPLDSACWQLSIELRGNCTPKRWIKLLQLPEQCGKSTGGISLETFQSILLDRLNTFASWTELEDEPYRLQLDKFLNIECVFEAVHQNFLRKRTGNALCSSDCLKVVSIWEDLPQLQLPAKDGIIYFSGSRAMGHLQLQILDPKGLFRRNSIIPEGVPVHLQITSSCIAGVANDSVSTSSENMAESETSQCGSNEFLCPLLRAPNDLEHHNIRVISPLPLDQLILSGSSLEIQIG